MFRLFLFFKSLLTRKKLIYSDFYDNLYEEDLIE